MRFYHEQGCREVSFCNGGHLFAIANTNIIHVYQTYTGENPPNYVFRGHTGKVVSIHWMDVNIFMIFYVTFFLFKHNKIFNFYYKIFLILIGLI